MSKVYKGYELLKAIADGEIKEGSRFKLKETINSIAILKNKILRFEKYNQRDLDTEDLLTYTFELIEDEAVDIDDIEELTQDCFDDWTEAKKINELVQAVKQLNKEIKSIKEKI